MAGGKSSVKSFECPPPISEIVVTPNWAGDLAFQDDPESQLRDSTGLAPVSPLSPPIRGSGTQKAYSIKEIVRASRCSVKQAISSVRENKQFS